MNAALLIVVVWAALIVICVFLGHRLEEMVHRGERRR